jgi:hypothetical protein
MNSRIIHAAIDEMAREMERRFPRRGYAGDEVPGMAALRAAPRPRRARDAEEPPERLSAKECIAHTRDRVADLRARVHPEEREAYEGWLAGGGLGEDDDPKAGGGVSLMPGAPGGNYDPAEFSSRMVRGHEESGGSVGGMAGDEAFVPGVALVRNLDNFGKPLPKRARPVSGLAIDEVTRLVPGISRVKVI